MAKREPHYKGLTAEKLKALDERELLKILPARARRTLKRGIPEQHQKVMERVKKAAADEKLMKKTIRTHARDMVIVPDMIGLKFAVYSGKEFQEFEVTAEMVGKYLGEFVLTRKPVKHSSPGVGATRSSLFVPVK
jgi:small subunit ribosomal protein S19